MAVLDNARYTRQEMFGELEGLRIRHPLVEATVILQGAHLVHFAPAGSRSWLWQSPEAQFLVGKAIRGGIPVCWPWFGDPARNPAPVRAMVGSEKAHGFARTALWSLTGLEERDEAVTVSLALNTTDLRTDQWWQGQAEATLRFRFAPGELTMALTTRNTGGNALSFSQALHTYLPTPKLSDTRIRGLDGAHYLDTLDDWSTRLQVGDILFKGETDRIYLAAPDLLIRTPDHTTRLSCDGSRSTVVWNPGPEKAARLGDFPDDGWTGMLCVETANAADDYRELAAGDSHTLSLTMTRS